MYSEEISECAAVEEYREAWRWMYESLFPSLFPLIRSTKRLRAPKTRTERETEKEKRIKGSPFSVNDDSLFFCFLFWRYIKK